MTKFPNLSAEMVRRDVSCDSLAKSVDVCDRTMRNKLAGRVPFTWPEVRTIHWRFFPDVPLDTLFEERAEQTST